MTLVELKEAIRQKTMEYEAALQAGIPHADLFQIYKELKDLQYLKVQAELKSEAQA